MKNKLVNIKDTWSDKFRGVWYMPFPVCDNPETTRIGIIQLDETKTYIKEQEKDKGFLMGKFTKLPTSPITTI